MNSHSLKLEYKILSSLLLLCFCAFIGCANANLNNSQRPEPTSQRRFALHRGNIKYRPGNTKIGIEQAIKQGFRLIEIDLRMSKDGSLFLFHDKRLSKDSFVGPKQWLARYAESLSSNELKKLCFPDNNGCAISFKQALSLIRNSDAQYLLDIKHASRQMLDLILKELAGMEDKVIIQAPSFEAYQYISSSDSKIAQLARCFSVDDVDKALKLSPAIIQIDKESLSAELVNKIKSNGAAILVKAIDGPDTVQEHASLFNLGADIILTDQNDLNLK